jgi:hypothetical protein
MLASLSMHCGFSHQKFHKLRWASTLNQKHLFVITSLSTTQFEYGVKFSMEIQIFRKIMEFILTLAVISPVTPDFLKKTKCISYVRQDQVYTHMIDIMSEISININKIVQELNHYIISLLHSDV